GVGAVHLLTEVAVVGTGEDGVPREAAAPVGGEAGVRDGEVGRPGDGALGPGAGRGGGEAPFARAHQRVRVLDALEVVDEGEPPELVLLEVAIDAAEEVAFLLEGEGLGM